MVSESTSSCQKVSSCVHGRLKLDNAGVLVNIDWRRVLDLSWSRFGLGNLNSVLPSFFQLRYCAESTESGERTGAQFNQNFKLTRNAWNVFHSTGRALSLQAIPLLCSCDVTEP